MSWARVALLTAATLGALALGAFAAYRLYPIPALALLQALIYPLAAPQEVTWAQGPPAAGKTPAGRPPNIVVIVADDLGFNDITAFGGGVAQGKVPTPRIDSLAHDGAAFVNGYAGHATCAPSRAALMTGRFPERFGFQSNATPAFQTKLVLDDLKSDPAFANRGVAPVIINEKALNEAVTEKVGLPLGEITLPQLVRQQGYRTLLVGKWHLGETDALQPGARGFDEWLGFTAGAAKYLPNDDPNVVNSAQDFDPTDKFLSTFAQPGVQKDNGRRFRVPYYMTDYLGDQAAAAIAANRTRPFMLYVAFNAPHTPLQALRADYDALSAVADHRLRVYGAMVRALDRNVGKILDALSAQGIAENTLVVFTSDNGGTAVVGLAEINRPYRGWKSTFFEGGIHTPFLLRWPAQVPAGAKPDMPVANVDIFATVATAVGAKLPHDRKIDGMNLIPYAQGTAKGPRPAPLYWRAGGYQAVLDGAWKLQTSNRGDRTWLYNLSSDPTEQTELSATHPDELARLRALLQAQAAADPPPLWSAYVEKPVRLDADSSVPVKPGEDFVYWPN